MAPGLAARILVWAYSDSNAYTLESCDLYKSDSFVELRLSASQFLQDQLDIFYFYSAFSEWFNVAEFPDVEEKLQPSEVAVFLKAPGAPDHADFRSIGNDKMADEPPTPQAQLTCSG
jgi:hypothetical protein